MDLEKTTYSKFKFFKHLVLNYGFKVCAIETPMLFSNAVNRYIDGETDDLNETVDKFNFTYRNNDVVDLLKWMRSYNKDQPDENRLKFYGYDIEGVYYSTQYVAKFVHKHISKYTSELDSLRLSKNRIGWFSGAFERKYEVAFKEDIKNRWNTILNQLLINRGRLIQKTSIHEFHFILDCMMEILQSIEASSYWDTEERIKPDLRDYFMAENILSILNYKYPDAKILVTAHNSHVNKNSLDQVNFGNSPFGTYLADILGDKYVNIGLLYGEGKLIAIDQNTKGNHNYLYISSS